MKNKIISIISLISVLIILIIRYIYTGIFLKCIFYEITGFYCPGCGITRCLISLVKLDFYQAFRYNALIIVLLPLALIYLVYYLYARLFHKKIIKINKNIWYVLLIIVICFGIMRNLDYFSWLAPTTIK